MILLPCPYCGPRNASEFRYVGEVSERPDPNATGAGEWRTYLYVRDNPAGWTTETWFHSAGCRQHLVVERHTVTNEVRASRLPAAQLLRDGQEERATGGSVANDGGGRSIK
ncbi:MAG: sarcosine oxidase subunit delta [Actinobacteria bacterium]|nr:sarcosine oxidase subunit delta [Actinomycetota bacterium]